MESFLRWLHMQSWPIGRCHFPDRVSNPWESRCVSLYLLDFECCAFQCVNQWSTCQQHRLGNVKFWYLKRLKTLLFPTCSVKHCLHLSTVCMHGAWCTKGLSGPYPPENATMILNREGLGGPSEPWEGYQGTVCHPTPEYTPMYLAVPAAGGKRIVEFCICIDPIRFCGIAYAYYWQVENSIFSTSTYAK